MKKYWVTLGAVSLFLTAGVLMKQNVLSAETVETDYDKISQEADRNRELLDIWKEHVKTLTKERDDAYRQLEHMRAASPAGGVAQFGGMESAPLPSPVATQQIEGLQSEVSRLQEELQKKTAGDPNRELQMQFSSLQRQLQQVKKDLSDARAEKDLLIQEKEKALSKVERLENSAAPVQDSAQWDSIQNESNVLRGENARLQSEIERLRRVNTQPAAVSANSDAGQGSFERRARELQYENETLQAQIEKLQVVEKELASTRGYFAPLVKDLQEKGDQLATENTALRTDISRIKSESSSAKSEIDAARSQNQRIQDENERLAGELDALKTQSQRTDADLRTARGELEQISSQIESYKAQLQLASADREKAKAIELQYQTLKDQNESLQKAYAVLEENSSSSETRMRDISAQMTAIQNDNRDLASREAGYQKTIEKYKAALSANLADMKNLRANFEAYLESLVASFEERQK